MPIEVEAPDGTVVEFPDGTAPETIKGVMAKQFGGGQQQPSKAVATWQGDKYQAEYDVPPGATDEQIKQASTAALRAKYPGVQFPDSGEVTRPSIGDVARDTFDNIAAGLGGGFDMLAAPGRYVNNAIGEGLASLGDFVLTGGGANPAGQDNANALRSYITASQEQPGLVDMIDRANPDRRQAPSAFASELFGAALLPIGPKVSAPKFGYNALARADEAAMGAAAKDTGNVLAKGVRADAQQIADAGSEFGVRVLRTDLKPPKTFAGKTARGLGEKIPYLGTGVDRAAQQAEREAATSAFVKEFGLTSADDTVAAVTNDLVATRGAALKKFTTEKTKVIEGVKGEVPVPNALKALQDQITRLVTLNSKDVEPVIAKLQGWESAIQYQSLSNIEDLRKIMGAAFSDMSMAHIKGVGEKAVNAIYGPLRADMAAFIKQKGGQEALRTWENANRKLSVMAGEINNTALKRVLNKADSTPETVASVIFGKSPSELNRLAKNLSPAGRAKVQSAIVLKAAEGATTDGVISPQKFATAMQAMERATGKFFAPEQKARLDGLTRLLQATQRASEAAVSPPTGVQNVIPVATAGLASWLGFWQGLAAAGAYGTLARVYENTGTAKILANLSKTKAGSPAEARLIERLGAEVSRRPAAFGIPANDVTAMPALPGRAAATTEQPQE